MSTQLWGAHNSIHNRGVCYHSRSLNYTISNGDWGQEEKWMTEDEMVGWHHQLDGRGFGFGVGDEQGGLVY